MILALTLFLTVPNLDGVLSLIGLRSLAHACPIGPSKALTNAHVIGDYDRYVWESLGHVGLLGAPRTTEKDLFRDLGYVAPWRGAFPTWYRVSKDAPKPGDRLWFLGWDFRKRKDAFAPRVFQSEVLRVRNGHVIMTPAGVPGTSGSCVLNQHGEVVAINSAGMELEDKSQVGIAVGVWGDLLDIGRGREEDVH